MDFIRLLLSPIPKNRPSAKLCINIAKNIKNGIKLNLLLCKEVLLVKKIQDS